MQILIVAATNNEISQVVSKTGPWQQLSPSLRRTAISGHVIDVVVTGVGMTATAVHTTVALCHNSYDLAINAGICGSFKNQFTLGEVVNVVSDFFPEMGAENGDSFMDLNTMGLMNPNDFPFTEGRIVNLFQPGLSCLNTLPKATGATVNTVHGNMKSIEKFRNQFDCDVESMEGAAFMYACKLLNVSFLQIRAVSNYVTDRNLADWNIPMAISSLNNFLVRLLHEIGCKIAY